MIDESKTEATKTETEQPKIEEEQTVTITQAKLDELINSKYKKGAEKATAKLTEELGVESLDSLREIIKAKAEADEAAKTELQKAQEAIEVERAEREKLSNELESVRQKNAIAQLALNNGVTESDYFALELERAKSKEGFDEATFIESLKESKPFLFGDNKPKAKTDTSVNNDGNPGSLENMISGMSINDLKKLQQNI